MLRRRQVYPKQAALKKGSSIEYVSENRIFTDADDYSMEIELPLADCPQNLDIFGMITRKDVDAGDIFFEGDPLRCESDLKVDGEPCELMAW